jgi:hypothetical protein
MASVVGKKRGTATYYYLVESARVDGKPRIVSQEYLGTADELAAAMRGGGLGLPDKTRHKEFGAAAATWGMLDDLGVAGVIDLVTGPAPPGQPLSTGTYLALAALNRLVAPCPKAAFADWWKTTARRTGSPRSPPPRWITGGSGTRCTRSRRSNWRRSRARSRRGSCSHAG